MILTLRRQQLQTMAVLGASKLLVCLLFFITPTYSAIDWLEKSKKELLDLRGSVFKNQKADILFLLDSSGSLEYSEFLKEKKFVTNLLNMIAVGYEATRVEVIPFHDSAYRYIKFISKPKRSKNKCYFNEEFNKLGFKAGMTNMKDAFQKAIDVCLGQWQGVKRSPMSQFKTVVILLTDGYWNWPWGDSDPVKNAQRLIKNKAEVFAIGVGRGVNFQNLQRLVDNQGNDKTHAFHLKDFSQFNELATYIRGDPYQEIWETVEVDKSKCKNRCDGRATCACGLVYGDFKCSCPKGMAGSGTNGDCILCPHGTYKTRPGYAKTCTKCPENSSHGNRGSSNHRECKCNPGHYGQPESLQPCKPLTCSFPTKPSNGFIVGGKCADIFGSECSYGCKEGFKLSGTANRKCVVSKVDSTKVAWSGDAVTCTEITCKTLVVPNAEDANGICKDHNEKPATSMTYRVTCRFKCRRGYRPTGDLERKCSLSEEWSGTETKCNEVRCDKLPKVPIGHYTPKALKCEEQSQRFDTDCIYHCPDGYHMEPGSIVVTTNPRVCNYENGTWDGQQRSCKDHTPPVLTCPSDQTLPNDKGKSTATVNWAFDFIDNSLKAGAAGVSKDKFTVVIKINNVNTDKPSQLKIGSHTVSYNVTDPDGNYKTCSFIVIVRDTEPPTCEFCPASQEIEITNDLPYRLNWKNPNCSDNSGLPPSVEPSKRKGIEVKPPALYTIEYTVADQAKPDKNVYNNCSFTIKITVPQCKPFKPPKNGASRCFEWQETLACTVACQSSFDFVFNPAQSYMCNKGKWSVFKNQQIPASDRLPWPDCSKRANPSFVKLQANPSYFYDGDCNNPNVQAKLKQDFITLLYPPNSPPFFCMFNPNCNVQNVAVHCGELDASAKRKRRSTTRQVMFKVKYVEKSNKVQSGSDDAANQNNFNLLKNEVEKKRAQVYNSLKKVDWNAFKVKSGLDLGGGVDKFNLKHVDGYCSEEGAVVRKCTNFELKWMKICNKNKGEITKCIRCPVGTYYDSENEKCTICPEGQFVNSEGALRCQHCPLGTWTFGDKKENFTSCQVECGPGYFSNTGIATCFQCPAGTYSSERRNKKCIVCPSGTTSVAAASQRLEDCGMVCAAGTYSTNGVEPCTPCPMGTYQASAGKTTCLPCPGRLSTYGTGAESASSCFEVNDCVSSPCTNNGRCVDTKESYRCECPAGFRGKNCEEEIDECAKNPCFDGATCVDKINDYLCLCPEGYSGINCDKAIETCKTHNPCVRGACMEQGAGAQCVCPVGYEGQFCELNTDECANNPCHNNAVCIGGVDTFRCLCRAGYSGKLCQINNDDCLNNPCKNGAKCIDGERFYSCQCPAGYTGAQCEHAIDECLSGPCQHGGKCTDKLNDFECACRPTYTGKRCEKQLLPNYDLAFQDRNSPAYAEVEKIIPDILQFTVAAWIRTTDPNPGVPLSYAVMDGGKTQDNALAIQDCSGVNLIINNQTVFLGVDINDGSWHHFAVTWQSSSGTWNAYVDGARVKTSPTPFQRNQVIRGGGVMMAGQEQDEIGGGFNAEESFIGDMSQLNIWSRVFTDNEVYNLAQTCDHAQGDIAAWADFRESLYGVYSVTPKSYACDFQNVLRYTNVIYNASIPSNDNKVLTSQSREACAQSCDVETSFWCRSFDFDKKSKKCYLSVKHSADNLVKYDSTATYDYYEQNCAGSLGVYSKKIVADNQMTASSTWNSLYAAYYGRLNHKPDYDANGKKTSLGSWCAGRLDTNQWLQVNLNEVKRISAVVTQGRQDSYDQWVKQYKLQYSTDGSSWTYYPQALAGNSDRNTKVRHELRVFHARYVRFRPQSWHSHISMRVEIHGCSQRKVQLADSVNECNNRPCINGGKCVNRYNGYLCLCSLGFTGMRCESAIPCCDPGTPIYGSKSSTNYNHGSTITFSCRAGYKITGSSSRACAGGEWTGTQPTCDDINECAESHGCAQLCRNTRGSYVCACSPGYKLLGNHCVDIKECGMDNGGCSHVCHEKAGGATCSCPSGMVFTKGKRTCVDVNECASNNGGCQHICVNTLRSFKCSCNKGYALNSNKRSCNALSCPSLPPVSHATAQIPSTLVGRTARYVCNAGYRAIGSTRRECQADRTWSGIQPRCQRAYCREVGTVKNAARTLIGYSSSRPVVGSIARFTCNAHHVMQGSRDRVCQADGSWSGELPRCIPAFCSKLNPPAKGTVQGFRFELGATLRITCATGYQLNPAASSFRTCVKKGSGGGSWSGTDPVCQLVDCKDPGQPYGGYRFIAGGTKYQATVTYTCKPKHHLQGKPTRVCQADGTWSGTKPVCLERSCGYLDKPANGKKKGDGHQYGESVDFECNTGYRLVGSSKLICQTNGLWTASVPTCQIVSCGDPGTPTNGRRFVNKFSYQSIVYFECNPGYKLVGSTNRICQASGVWTNSQPTCVATSCGALRVGPSGTITSPNYPSNYNNNDYCTWEVRVTAGKKVRLDFKDFKTEAGKDRLLIYDTGKPFPTIYFDGTTYLPGSFTSSGNSLRLRFMSDGQNTLAGFKVNYRQTDCGGTLSSPTGYIQSPSFPKPYANNVDCVWLIARPSEKIEVALLEFDTEPTHDFLAFTLNREQNKDKTYEWSGLGTPIQPFKSDNFMWLRFKTNLMNTSKAYKGFRAKYYKHNPYQKK